MYSNLNSSDSFSKKPTQQPPLRTHQKRVLAVVHAIARRITEAKDILAAVTPGGGKSLLPVIAGARLIEAGIVDRICWIVPRDSLRMQAEEAFSDARWRDGLDHRISIRAADNTPNPCRGLQGYVTTYQSVAAAPSLHLSEFKRNRYLIVVDEMHHLPSLAEIDSNATDIEESSWSAAILPLLECSKIRLLLSGTLERADGKGILWLPYKKGEKARTREIDMDAPGWAIVGYSRAEALAEKAVLPITFGALDGSASWLDEDKNHIGPQRLSESYETTRQALFTALRTEFAEFLLRESFEAVRTLRADRKRERGDGPSRSNMGLGKLLVVAHDQASAQRYMDLIKGWLPADKADAVVRIAVSGTPGAHENLAAFRLLAQPCILVTCAMAYEGLDAPQVSVVAALTHIRSRAWLEQMIARATRVDPYAGPWENQRAVVFHPDDLMFRRFRTKIEEEQGTLSKKTKPRQRSFNFMPDHIERRGIVPLESNALTLRFDTLAPGPSFADKRPENSAAQAELLEPPAIIERRLRQQIGEMVASQAVEDQDAGILRQKEGTYHLYNATLKRVLGNKPRGEMTISELESSVAWLERNRVSEHLHILDQDSKYLWEKHKILRASQQKKSLEKGPQP